MSQRLFDSWRKLTITEFLFFGKFAVIKSRGKTISLDELEAIDVSSRLVGAGATLTLTKEAHAYPRSVLFDTAAGSVVTLPAATGSGVRFRVQVSVLATSNSHVLAAAGTDEFVGHMVGIDTDTADATIAFAAVAADDFDKISFNRTTSGIAGPGDYIEVEDVVAGSWQVNGAYRATGTIITPFSTT